MKNSTLKPLQSVAFLSFIATEFVIPFLPVQAQAVDTALANTVKAACTRVAESRGFQVKEVISVEPTGADAAKAVLSLTRNGQPFRLTCGYTKKAGAVFDDNSSGVTAPTETTNAPTTVAPPDSVAGNAAPADLSRLWWLLLPILGLPLLAWLMRGHRDADVYGGRSDMIVQSEERSVDIHSQPGTHYPVTGTLMNGQRVTLSGRYNEKWAELAEGGWVPTQYLSSYQLMREPMSS